MADSSTHYEQATYTPQTAVRPALLELAGVRKRYGGVHALRGAGLTIASEGSVHGLIGENGSGKSTMLSVLSGQIRPDAGTISMSGTPVSFQTPVQALARGIAMVSQESAVAPNLSIAENVLLGRRLVRTRSGINWGETFAKAAAVLTRLGLDYDPRRPVRSLRPDQRQMVEIARALSINARVLVLDEPTSSLTDDEVAALFRVIRQLKGAGVSTILVTHRLPELFAICDELTVLRDGETVATGAATDFDSHSLVAAMVGSVITQVVKRPTRPRQFSEQPAVQLSGVGVGEVVKDVDLSIGKGEIVGVAGLVGAGRSELLEGIFGVRSRSGVVNLDGQALTSTGPRSSIARRVGMVPADRKSQGVVLSMSVADNMSMVANYSRARMDRPQARRDTPLVLGLSRELRVRAPGINALVGTLSGGNQQKVALGKWLADPPALLLLDEPTRGVDVASKAEIHQILVDLAAKGVALLVSSSENEELLTLCDRIVVMFRGRVVADLDRSDADEAVLARLAGGHR